MERDEIIIKKAKMYRNLPVTNAETVNKIKKTVVSKRKTGYSSISEDSPMKRRCKLADSTTEEEDE